MTILKVIGIFFLLGTAFMLLGYLLAWIFSRLRIKLIGLALLIVIDFFISKGSSAKMFIISALLRLVNIELSTRMISIRGILLTVVLAVLTVIFFIGSASITRKLRKVNNDSKEKAGIEDLFMGWAALYAFGIGIIALVLPSIEAMIPWQITHFDYYIYFFLLVCAYETFNTLSDTSKVLAKKPGTGNAVANTLDIEDADSSYDSAAEDVDAASGNDAADLMPVIWVCPNCGTENARKFCPQCGVKRAE